MKSEADAKVDEAKRKLEAWAFKENLQLRDKSIQACRATIGELAEIGKPAVPALIQALADENQHVRSSAADALDWIGTPKALKAIEASKQQVDKWGGLSRLFGQNVELGK